MVSQTNGQVLEEMQKILRKHLPEMQQKYQVRQLGIFGSFVRGEQTDTSRCTGQDQITRF